MGRIPPLDLESAPPEARPLLEKDLATHDEVLNTTAVAARRPVIAEAAKALGQAVATGGTIPAQLRLLMNVRVATLVGCPF